MEKLIIPSLLTVSDVISLVDKVLKISLPDTGIDSKFIALYTRNKQIFDRLVKNQKSSLKSEFTELLRQADNDRGADFMSVRDIIGGISMSQLEEPAAKASKLNTTIERVGKNLYSLGYKAESARLLTLFVEFDKPDNQLLLADLGIIQYYNSLKVSQEAFELVSSQKSEEQTLKDNDSEAATLVMGEMIPAFTSLVAMLQLYAELEPATYSEMYNRVVTFISETNTVARARKTRKHNKPEATPTA